MFNFRKTLLIGLILSLAVAVFSGCSGKTTTPTTPSTEKPIAMRIAHAYPETTQHGRNMIFFKEKVEEYTNGRVQVTIYPNAQLGSIDKEFSLVLSGDVEALYNVGGITETVDPAEAIYNIPFLLKVAPGDGRHVKLIGESDKVEGILKARQEKLGFKRLGNVPTLFGFFIVANNLKPVTSVSDAAGLKIRHPGGMMGPIYLESMGASAITVAGAEVPVALTQGVVDGLTTTILHYHDARWHTKYLTLPFQAGFSLPFMTSLTWWNSLPADIQDTIENKVMPELMEFAYEEVAKRELAVMEEMQKAPFNVEIAELDMSNPETQKWMKEVRDHAIQKFIDKVGEDARIMVEETLRLGETIQ